MTVLRIGKVVFTSLGLVMLACTYVLYSNTASFLAEASRAEGTVVGLEESRSSDSITYRPVVEFADESGRSTTFISSTGSNPPGYTEGQKVEVLYPRGEPQKAKINGFFSLWAGSIIVGSMGAVFLLVGVGIIFLGKSDVQTAAA